MFTPGTTFIYEGKTADGPERVETYVSYKTREVLGVKCTVVRDKAFLNGKLSEDTFDWYAQDKEGNVWYFGEDTKEYENGKVVSTKGRGKPAWTVRSRGIVMEANPRVGDSYRQEYYEGEAEDMAEVLSLDASGLNDAVSVPYGSFGDVLMTKEWNPLEPRRPRVQVLRARHGAHRRRADPGRNGHERAGGHHDRAVVAPSRELDPAASQGCCILWSSISIVTIAESAAKEWSHVSRRSCGSVIQVTPFHGPRDGASRQGDVPGGQAGLGAAPRQVRERLLLRLRPAPCAYAPGPPRERDAHAPDHRGRPRVPVPGRQRR